MQPDTLLAASLRQFAQHIAAERGGIDDIVVGKSGIEHGESLVVARGEADVARARRLDRTHPLPRVEACGTEAARKLGVLLVIEVFVGHGPLAGSQHAVKAPMEEYPEAVVAERLARPQVVGRGNVSGLRMEAAAKQQAQSRVSSRFMAGYILFDRVSSVPDTSVGTIHSCVGPFFAVPILGRRPPGRSVGFLRRSDPAERQGHHPEKRLPGRCLPTSWKYPPCGR